MMKFLKKILFFPLLTMLLGGCSGAIEDFVNNNFPSASTSAINHNAFRVNVYCGEYSTFRNDPDNEYGCISFEVPGETPLSEILTQVGEIDIDPNGPFDWTDSEFEEKYDVVPAKNLKFGRWVNDSGEVLSNDSLVTWLNNNIYLKYDYEKAIVAGDGVFANDEKVTYVTIPYASTWSNMKNVMVTPTCGICRFDRWVEMKSSISELEDTSVIYPSSEILAQYHTPFRIRNTGTVNVELYFRTNGSYANFPNITYTKDLTDVDPWATLEESEHVVLEPAETVYFYGENPNGFNTYNSYGDYTKLYLQHEDLYWQSNATASVSVGGDLSTLIGSNLNLPASNSYDFAYLFGGYGSEIILDAKDLYLPFNKLNKGSYFGMFSGCINLKTAPKLPAKNLAESCYESMFQGCQYLQSAPELPATTLARRCYASMFNGCSYMPTAQPIVLPATSLVEQCYYRMFYNCGNVTGIRVAFTSWGFAAEYSTLQWVYGVASVGIFYCPSSLTKNSDVNYIPNGWMIEEI